MPTSYVAKSHFLRIYNNQESTLKSQTFNAIAASDVHSLDLVKQCKFLASHFEPHQNLTEEILSNMNSNEPSVQSVRERILSADRTNVLSSSVGQAPQGKEIQLLQQSTVAKR